MPSFMASYSSIVRSPHSKMKLVVFSLLAVFVLESQAFRYFWYTPTLGTTYPAIPYPQYQPPYRQYKYRYSASAVSYFRHLLSTIYPRTTYWSRNEPEFDLSDEYDEGPVPELYGIIEEGRRCICEKSLPATKEMYLKSLFRK